MWIHGNYHAITCSVTTMEFQSIYSSLPYTRAQASGLCCEGRSVAQPGMAGWAGMVVMLPQTDCMAEPELLLASSCYPPIISARATLSSKRCPLGAKPGMTVLSCHFLDMCDCPVLWINLCFCPKALRDCKSPELHPLKCLFSLREVQSTCFILCIHSFKKYWTLASCPAWGFRSQTVPALRKLPVMTGCQPGEQLIIG